MICSVNEDSTERLAQRDDYGHFRARKQYDLGLSRQLQNWVFQSTPPSPGHHKRLIIKFKPTFNCNWSSRLTLLPFPLSRVFNSTTRAGHLRVGNGLGQILHFSDFNKLGDLNTLLTLGLSNDRRLDTSHTNPSFRSVPSILPANHNSIIRLLQVIHDIAIYLRQYQIPWVVNRVFADTTRNGDSTQQHWNPVVCEKSHWVNRGISRKLCTHQIAESMQRWLIVTRSRFGSNRGISSAGPRWNKVVFWKT